MSIAPEIQAQWASIVLTNRSVVEAVIKEALAMEPKYPIDTSRDNTTAIAMIAKEREGYEVAIQNIFGKIPGDRDVNVSSKFMDMT